MKINVYFLNPDNHVRPHSKTDLQKKRNGPEKR